MTAVLSLLVIVTVSIIITRIASVALIHTGLSKESARFQARSAFTGVGFTTSEAESVVKHPVRRRIILLLMLVGNAGVVTAVSSLILTFVDQDREGGASLAVKIVILVAGLVVLWGFASSQWVERHLAHLIDRVLRRYAKLEIRDYASLMHLAGEYRIVELEVEEDDWIAERTLAELGLRDEGVVVLGIVRGDGTFVGAPKGHTQIRAQDTLILYGRVAALEEVDERKKSWRAEREHEEAVREQEEVAAEEERQDPASEEEGGARATREP